MIAARPKAATPAPRRPPTIAWLLESGIPARVATKTRMMDAPIATTIESGVRASLLTIAVPIVAATAVVKRYGPIMLQMAVRKTAFPGESAFVATTVAMECDASLSPLTKLSASARTMPKMIRGAKPIMSVPSRYRSGRGRRRYTSP